MEKKVYSIPVRERYQIRGTVNRKYYIYDMLRFTTVKDQKGKDRIFSEKLSFVIHFKEQLESEYRKELTNLGITFYETWKDQSNLVPKELK